MSFRSSRSKNLCDPEPGILNLVVGLSGGCCAAPGNSRGDLLAKLGLFFGVGRLCSFSWSSAVVRCRCSSPQRRDAADSITRTERAPSPRTSYIHTHTLRGEPTSSVAAMPDKWVDWSKNSRSRGYRGSGSFATFMIIGRKLGHRMHLGASPQTSCARLVG